MDGFDDSDESSGELTNSNLNGNFITKYIRVQSLLQFCIKVTCKNCSLSVECHNCTQSHQYTQSTIPMTATANGEKLTTSSLPTPTIPAPERVVEIVASNNVPSQNTATASQSLPITTPVVVSATSTNTNPSTPTQTANTKSIGDGNQVTDESANLTTDDLVINSSDGVTVGNE